jgi:hypothetical protein
MAQTRPSAVKPVSVTIGKIKHDGIYYVKRGMLYVRSPLGTKVTQVGGSSPEIVAKLLLSELVREKKT